ncbi:MAG: mechanosensitive ion channel family protein [Elusimicrobia bacterium]|nr:mechanosensitive ion channel family protein [Elusimicrobiota bacterium]
MPLRDALAAAFTPTMLWSFPLLLAAIAALSAAAPAARRRLGAAGLLALAAAVGLLLAAALRTLGLQADAGFYRITHGLAVLLLALAAINAAAATAFGVILPALRLPLSPILRDLILAVLYVGAALTVAGHEGANLTGILATSAMVTAVVAFSLQDTLGNVIGGMVLHLESSFAPGDWIRVGEEEGVVREIRWRQTTLDTGSGNIIVIPNSSIMKGTVTVLGRAAGLPPRRLMRVPFNVYYDRQPNEVIAAVADALRADPPAGVAADPPPWCVLVDFAEGHAVYAARYWLRDLGRVEAVASEVRVRVYHALARAGIKISIPSRSIVVTQQDADVQERRRRLELERRLAALRGVDIFQSLTDEEVRTLAGRLKATPFARGEAITREGAAEDWLFIVYAGEADVRVHAAGGPAFQSVARLKAGSFLGEMALMTGEPRSATVVAVNDVGCYRLDRAGFKDILARRPQLAEAISLILVQRRLELKSAREGLDEEAGRRNLGRAQGDLLSRIRSIFSLGG